MPQFNQFFQISKRFLGLEVRYRVFFPLAYNLDVIYGVGPSHTEKEVHDDMHKCGVGKRIE